MAAVRLASPWPPCSLARCALDRRRAGQHGRRAAARRDVFYIVQPSELARHPRARRRERHARSSPRRSCATCRWSAGCRRSTTRCSSSARTGWASPNRSTSCATRWRTNWAVTVFPEGTTTDGQSLLPFKTADAARARAAAARGDGPAGAARLRRGDEEIGWIGDEAGRRPTPSACCRGRGSFPLDGAFPRPVPPRGLSRPQGDRRGEPRRIEEALVARSASRCARSRTMSRRVAYAALDAAL